MKPGDRVEVRAAVKNAVVWLPGTLRKAVVTLKAARYTVDRDDGVTHVAASFMSIRPLEASTQGEAA